MASAYRVGKATIGKIIDEVCDAITEELGQQYIPELCNEDWVNVANTINGRWNLPNCLGAIDGKHIGIRCPPDAGSLFFNYKVYEFFLRMVTSIYLDKLRICLLFLQKFHSIVLMAIADGNYKFINIDVGAYGSEGDAGVFASTTVGKKILRNTLQLPEDTTVFGRSLPFFFIADDAFPLCHRIMKPFTSRRGATLSNEELVFNYRLSRARRCVENAFGILSARWLCLSRTMFCHPDKAQKIVSACCILHNFLMQTSKDSYCPPKFADYYDANGVFVPGDWRLYLPADNDLVPNIPNRATIGEAASIRDHLKKYVNSDEGSLHWQRNAVFLD